MYQGSKTISSIITMLAVVYATASTTSLAEQKKAVKRVVPVTSTPAPVTPAPKANTKKSAGKSSGEKVDSATAADGYVASSSTHIDFTETSIDGKMKAPDGFMLQGHQSSSLSQMVKLRSNFRNELNNSKSATKALVK